MPPYFMAARLPLKLLGDTGIVVTGRKGKPVADTSVDLHALRATVITHLLRAGVGLKDVQELARHKTASMTLGVYARSWPQDRKNAVERLTFLQSGQKADTTNAQPNQKASA